MELLYALKDFGQSLGELLSVAAGLILPWAPLALWVVFWLLAVNWTKLRVTLAPGAWLAIVLVAAIWILVWGSLDPAGAARHHFFGLSVSNFVEKTIYVSGLICIMFLSGALQLSGFARDWCDFEDPILLADAHDSHGGHDEHHG